MISFQSLVRIRELFGVMRESHPPRNPEQVLCGGSGASQRGHDTSQTWTRLVSLLCLWICVSISARLGSRDQASGMGDGRYSAEENVKMMRRLSQIHANVFLYVYSFWC